MSSLKRVAVAATLFALIGCRQPGATVGTAADTGAAADTSTATSESERARQMQEKAAELERRLAEIQEQRANGQITEQQAIDAILQLDAERRALLAEGDSGAH